MAAIIVGCVLYCVLTRVKPLDIRKDGLWEPPYIRFIYFVLGRQRGRALRR